MAEDAWQRAGDLCWAPVASPPDGQRWVVVRTAAGEERTRATLTRQAEKTRQAWEQQLWHLGNRRFACEADARAALTQQLKKRPDWLEMHSRIVAHPKYRRRGRPRRETTPDHLQWQIEATATLNDAALTRAVRRKASFLVATNVLDAGQLADLDLIHTYKEQGSVERGFAFLRTPISRLVGVRE